MEFAALFGGATGLIATGLTYIMDYFKQKRDASARAEEAALQVQLATIEVQKLQTMTTGNIQLAVTQGDTAATVGSYESDKATYTDASSAPKFIKYLLGFIDFLRGVIRPGTTLGYGVLFSWMVILAVGIVGAEKLAATNLDKLIDSAIYLATTTTLWWFGVRPLEKK